MPKKIVESPTTIPLETFWRWLQAHANCIVRAGTPETLLFDDEDLHWHFANDEDGSLIVQLIRGKKTVGEILVQPGDIAYVECHPGDGEEFLFDCISEAPDSRVATYHFVLSHGYDREEPAAPGRFVH
jgi:hypothetical protein